MDEHEFHNEEHKDRQPVGNLTDFVEIIPEAGNLEIEVAVKPDGRVALFHNMPFKDDLSHLEYDNSTRAIDFVLVSGEKRGLDVPLKPEMTKNMQNTYQVLMILMDHETGYSKKGFYKPLLHAG